MYVLWQANLPILGPAEATIPHLAETSRKDNKMMIEEERKQGEIYLSFQREEAEKNRQHEFDLSLKQS